MTDFWSLPLMKSLPPPPCLPYRGREDKGEGGVFLDKKSSNHYGGHASGPGMENRHTTYLIYWIPPHTP